MPDNSYPEAILFDLDDTIIAHTAVAGDLWQSLCFEYAGVIGRVDSNELLRTIDNVRDWFWADPERHRQKRLNLFQARRELLEFTFSEIGLDDISIAHQIADKYSTRREEIAELFPGSLDTLEYFKTLDIKMALVTNGASDLQRAKIERFGLSRFFDYILVEGEYGVEKPDKSVFLHALNILEVNGEDTWMIGDDLNRDIAGAQNVGVFSVWNDWRKKGLPDNTSIKPDRTITAISELVLAP